MVTPPDDTLVQVALAPDAETAERWANALEAAGVEAHISLLDGAAFRPLGSAYGQLVGEQPFVYPVLVGRLQRRAAARILENVAAIESGATITPRAIAGGAAVLAISMLLVAYLAWARGEL